MTQNKNTAWLNQRGSWVAIIVAIVGVRLLLGMANVTNLSWLVINLIHSVFTLYFFHFVRGSMLGDFEGESGKYDELTFWEQIDEGRQNTPTRKFLTVVPAVLFLLSYNETRQTSHTALFYINVILSASVLIGKLPFMHRRRIFGLNKMRRFVMPAMDGADSPSRRKTPTKKRS